VILGGVAFRNLDAPAGSFVGRSDAIETLRAAVKAHPVVAVVGTAGAGKTRTTIELFARHGRELAPHGAWFVDLRDVTDEAGMLAAIAGALGISLGRDPIPRLASAIGDKTLVLDDFEKIVGCAPILPKLGGRLVITTREVLRIGEHRVELGALPSNEAEQLFVARAGTATNDDVRALVQSLDGLPLAIELAASRARVLSPRQLREQLCRRFDLLRRGETTLRGAIDVSWELLSPNERAVLAQCSVFRGSFTLEAAEGVVRAEGWVLDAIESTRSSRSPSDRWCRWFRAIRFAIDCSRPFATTRPKSSRMQTRPIGTRRTTERMSPRSIART
jgi:predicted ATPase